MPHGNQDTTSTIQDRSEPDNVMNSADIKIDPEPIPDTDTVQMDDSEIDSPKPTGLRRSARNRKQTK